MLHRNCVLLKKLHNNDKYLYITHLLEVPICDKQKEPTWQLCTYFWLY